MKYVMRMKKIISLLGACCLALCAVASESPTPSASETQSVSQASATIIYRGPAYSFGSDDLIPEAGSSVRVVWTSEGCSVNGEDGYLPQPVKDGGYPMKVNGSVKYMNYRVNYDGVFYYFQTI